MKRRDLRKKIFEVVSQNGDHLSSNLGVVVVKNASLGFFDPNLVDLFVV